MKLTNLFGGIRCCADCGSWSPGRNSSSDVSGTETDTRGPPAAGRGSQLPSHPDSDNTAPAASWTVRGSYDTSHLCCQNLSVEHAFYFWNGWTLLTSVRFWGTEDRAPIRSNPARNWKRTDRSRASGVPSHPAVVTGGYCTLHFCVGSFQWNSSVNWIFKN